VNDLVELVLGADQDIKESILSFLTDRGIEKAYLCGAVGSVKDLLLVAPSSLRLPPVLEKTFVDGPLEIVSFTGQAMLASDMDESLRAVYRDVEGRYFLHLHASAALAGGRVVGGGLWQGKTFRALSVYIMVQEKVEHIIPVFQGGR
jgi:predicted DNA-binding protein with PD1-like motif